MLGIDNFWTTMAPALRKAATPFGKSYGGFRAWRMGRKKCGDRLILERKLIEVYGEDRMSRDFTFVDDLVEPMVRSVDLVSDKRAPVEGDTLLHVAPFHLVNIVGGVPSLLMGNFVEPKKALGKRADEHFQPMQEGGVPNNTAAPDLLERLIGYKIETPISGRAPALVGWFSQRYSL